MVFCDSSCNIVFFKKKGDNSIIKSHTASTKMIESNKHKILIASLHEETIKRFEEDIYLHVVHASPQTV